MNIHTPQQLKDSFRLMKQRTYGNLPELFEEIFKSDFRNCDAEDLIIYLCLRIKFLENKQEELESRFKYG